MLSLEGFGRPAIWARRLLWAIGLVAMAVYTTAALGGPGDGSSGVYSALYAALFAIPGTLCLLRARLVRDERLAWAAAGVAMWCWAVGSGYWSLVLANAESASYPSWSDLLWLGYYGMSFAGLLMLMRSGPARLRPNMWMDVAVGALAIATIGAALLYRPIIASTGGSLSAVATNLAYPLFDVLVVSLIFGVFVINDWRPGRVWVLLGVVWVLQAVTDTFYLYQVAEGTYVEDGFIDTTWPALMLLIALAAWQRPAAPSRVWAQGPWALIVTIAFAGVGLFVLTYDHWHRIDDVAIVLATLTLLLAFIRAALTFSEIRTLAHGKKRLVEHQLILNAAGDGIMGVDADGALTFANPAAARMVGHSAQEMAGRDMHELLHHTRPDGSTYPRADCPMLTSLRDGSVHHCDDDVYWRKDGTSFAVDMTSNPIIDGERTNGAVIVFRDVSDRREVERVKDQFASVVSHELRTPLTSIRASLGLLASDLLGPLPAGGRRMVDIAVQNTDRLVRLINDILDLEHIASSAMNLHLVRCDAADLIVRAADAVLAMAIEGGVTVTVLAEPTPLEADEDRVIQTLTNLIGNAVKFSPRGSSVRVSCERRGDEILFTISDDGRGIPADKLETIFERFEQVDSSHSRQEGGTGLGLAISRSIVEQHGGRIWAQSMLGEGSVLSFVIPSPAEDRPSGGYAVSVQAPTTTSRGNVCEEADHELEAHPACR